MHRPYLVGVTVGVRVGVRGCRGVVGAGRRSPSPSPWSRLLLSSWRRRPRDRGVGVARRCPREGRRVRRRWCARVRRRARGRGRPRGCARVRRRARNRRRPGRRFAGCQRDRRCVGRRRRAHAQRTNRRRPGPRGCPRWRNGRQSATASSVIVGVIGFSTRLTRLNEPRMMIRISRPKPPMMAYLTQAAVAIDRRAGGARLWRGRFAGGGQRPRSPLRRPTGAAASTRGVSTAGWTAASAATWADKSAAAFLAEFLQLVGGVDVVGIDREDLAQAVFFFGVVYGHRAEPQPGVLVTRIGDEREIEHLAGLFVLAAPRQVMP